MLTFVSAIRYCGEKPRARRIRTSSFNSLPKSDPASRYTYTAAGNCLPYVSRWTACRYVGRSIVARRSPIYALHNPSSLDYLPQQEKAPAKTRIAGMNSAGVTGLGRPVFTSPYCTPDKDVLCPYSILALAVLKMRQNLNEIEFTGNGM